MLEAGVELDPPPGPSFWLSSVLGGSKLKTLNNNLQCTHIFTDKRTCFLTGTYVECSVFPSFSLYVLYVQYIHSALLQVESEL
jgi:hypothetical protein